MNQSFPRITVIVTCYNNEDTIEAAVASVLNQSLDGIQIIIVNDCSTDNSVEVVERICSEHPQVEFISTPVNSGCVATPRNAAFSLVRGEFVQFLDGDDELMPNACYNLYWNAVRTGADVCTGHIVRQQVATGERNGWHRWLFQESRTIYGADSFPDLVYDSTATNKLYRWKFLQDEGLRFTEGVYFEDIEFTSHVYARARVIRMIPDEVYTWMVYPVAQRLTMTADWKNIKSYGDRMRAFQSAQQAYRSAGEHAIADKLVEKTLKHDLWLFLDPAIREKDYATVLQLWSKAYPTLEFVTPKILSQVPMRQRFMIAALLKGDLDALAIAQSISTPGRFRGAIVGNSWYAPSWDHADSVDDRTAKYRALYGNELHSLVEHRLKFEHKAYRVSGKSGRAEIVGTTFDQLDLFDKEKPIQVILRVRRNGASFIQAIPGKVLHWEKQVLHWQVSVAKLEDISWLRNELWNFELCLIQGELVAQGPIKAPKKFKRTAFVPGRHGTRLQAVTRDRLSISRDNSGFLRIRRWARPGVAALPAKVLSSIERNKQVASSRLLKKLDNGQILQLVSRRSRFQKLDQNLVLVESHMGKQYSDSPRALAESLRAANPDVRIIWSFAVPKFVNACPENAVVRHSKEYAALLGRAAVVIDNQGFPGYYKRRENQFYLQTWHGVPLKAMGTEAPFKQAAEIKTLRKSVANWSLTYSPTPYYDQHLNRAMTYQGPTLRSTLPRNDILLESNPAQVKDLKRQLGLRQDRRYVLWAPTFREASSKMANYGFDFKRWIADMPEDVDLLVRPHYLTKLHVPGWAKNRVIDVSDVQDVSILYLLADALITDYSSVMFDFALTRKPLFIFASDYESYRNEQRGLNFDLAATLPQEFSATMEQLCEKISITFADDQWSPSSAYLQFVKKYCGEQLPNGTDAGVQEIMRRIR